MNALNQLSDEQLVVRGLDLATKRMQSEEIKHLNKIKKDIDLILKIPHIGEKKSKYGLTRKELVGLRLLQYISKESDPNGEKAKALPKEYKIFLAKFVEDSLGDMKLNKKLSSIMSPKPKSVSKWCKFKSSFGKVFGIKSLILKQDVAESPSNEVWIQMRDKEKYD